MAEQKTISELSKEVKKYYRAHGRDNLPWRKVQTPYRVFVSEMMLQQTQVDRVIPKFNAFVERFPSFEKLGSASLSEVYTYWQGLGYNRRAKFVRDAARIISQEHQGVLPKNIEALMHLPGIGPYTAGAIGAFAYGTSEPFVETNIRTAVTYHVYPKQKQVDDASILKPQKKLEPKKGAESKKWYAALMDYGAYLKRSGVKLNHKSAGYLKQKAFKGSQREIRGSVIREIHKTPMTEKALCKALPFDPATIKSVLRDLSSEGLIVCRRLVWTVAK